MKHEIKDHEVTRSRFGGSLLAAWNQLPIQQHRASIFARSQLVIMLQSIEIVAMLVNATPTSTNKSSKHQTAMRRHDAAGLGASAAPNLAGSRLHRRAQPIGDRNHLEPHFFQGRGNFYSVRTTFTLCSPLPSPYMAFAFSI